MLNRLRSLFEINRFQSVRKRRGARLFNSVSSVQRLETRNMLAGNVLASLSANGGLTLIGDDQANAVDVAVISGDLVVRGRENTTINGLSANFTVAATSATIGDDFFAQLGNGDDVLFVEGVTVSGRAFVFSSQGNNSIGFTDSTIGGDLHIGTSSGTDTINIDTVQIGSSLSVRTGRGADTIRVVDTNIGNDAVLVTGTHDDSIVLDNVNVADDLIVRSGAGADNVVIVDSTIGDRLRAITGRGNDFVMFDAASISGKAVIRTGGGSDTVATTNAGLFGSLRLRTGAGGDAVQIDPTTAVSGRSIIRRNEAATVSAAVIDRELNDATTGALTRSNAADNFFAALATLAPLSLNIDTSANTTTQSSETLVTNDSNFQLAVTTQPGATVAVDADNDGQFDDGTTTADASGNALLGVSLVNDASNAGANVLTVQASNGVDTPLTEQIDVYYAMGTVVRFDSSLGFWDVELFDDDAPNTVGAFLEDLTRYNDTIIHRNVSNFIIQGGGFGVSGTTVTDVTDFRAPTNESVPANSKPQLSNLRGTISTAQVGGNVNSFTGQWFFNTIDNDATSPINNLDAVPHTAFGRVIGTGMTVVDTINSIAGVNVTSLLTNASALTDVPLVNYTAGTVPTIDNFIQINSVAAILTPPGTENTFGLPENSAVGTSVGTLTPATTATPPVIFEFDAPGVATELKLNADDHLEGELSAPVVLIEYISLQCPSCAAAHPVVQQLLADNAGDVIVVRRHLPNDTSTGGNFEHSFEAALAAEAAGRQGKFDEMVTELLSRQSEWNNNFTAAQAQAFFEDVAANTLSLNLTQFNADIADPALAARINRDITDAAALNATGTPTFFLNGTLNSGTPTTAQVQAALQAINPTFGLNRRSGEITVINSTALDYEVTPSFTLDITRADQTGTTEDIQATINLIDAFAG